MRLWPERPTYTSLGQRPGYPDIEQSALKGRDIGRCSTPSTISRPFRAKRSFITLPRALPWAGIYRAFSAMGGPTALS